MRAWPWPRAKGKLRGKQPKLKPAQEQHLVKLWNDGTHTTAGFADLFAVGRHTVYGALHRHAVSAEPAN